MVCCPRRYKPPLMLSNTIQEEQQKRERLPELFLSLCRRHGWQELRNPSTTSAWVTTTKAYTSDANKKAFLRNQTDCSHCVFTEWKQSTCTMFLHNLFLVYWTCVKILHLAFWTTMVFFVSGYNEIKISLNQHTHTHTKTTWLILQRQTSNSVNNKSNSQSGRKSGRSEWQCRILLTVKAG